MSRASRSQRAYAVASRVCDALADSDDLRRAPWQGSDNVVAGHCYVASEAIWHALGGLAGEWRPQFIRHEGGPHWFLRHIVDGTVLDVTMAQFELVVPYERARNAGFLTSAPSKRAAELMRRAGVKATS